MLNFLATHPSKKSVNAATTNKIIAINFAVGKKSPKYNTAITGNNTNLVKVIIVAGFNQCACFSMPYSSTETTCHQSVF